MQKVPGSNPVSDFFYAIDFAVDVFFCNQGFSVAVFSVFSAAKCVNKQ